MMIMNLISVVSVLLFGSASGFVGPSVVNRAASTKLHLENWVADMIDGELWRQGHKAEYERAWMEKNRAAVLQSLGSNDNMNMLNDEEAMNRRQLIKDKKLAQANPQQYCADRCIATGNCDVYEDM